MNKSRFFVLGAIALSLVAAMALAQAPETPAANAVKGKAPKQAAKEKPKEIKLPPPKLDGAISVEVAMLRIKCVRSYKNKTPLTMAQVSQILWAANGNLPVDAITGPTKKVVPSAGALYPLEAFIVTGKGTVVDLPAGVYQYKPRRHSLKLVVEGDKRTQTAHAALSQMWMKRAPAIVVIGAVFPRTTVKYGPRGMNYVYMESGNATQNIFLQAQSLGLQAAAVGAFFNDKVKAVLKLPKGVTPLMLAPIGTPAAKKGKKGK
jgi:SagB-type dehydrogenase family enzyme